MIFKANKDIDENKFSKFVPQISTLLHNITLLLSIIESTHKCHCKIDTS